MKRAVIITDDGFEDEEVIYPLLRLKEAGIEVVLSTPNKQLVRGRISYPLERLVKYFSNLIDTKELEEKDYDLVIIPGGFEAPDRLRINNDVLVFIKTMNQAGKIVASICHGPRVLISAGILKDRESTAHISVADDLKNSGAIYINKSVVISDNIITAQHPRDIPSFMEAVLRMLS